ncbi:MAG: hypothetical protein AAGI15_09190 [Pseudomonadota bacterium]
MAVGAALSSSVAVAASPWLGGSRPISLSVTAPGSLPPGAILNDAGWSLGFRLEARDWLGYQEVRERFQTSPTGDPGEDFEVLILEDPDDCLDLSHTGTVRGPLNNSCPGGADELFIRFALDGNESPGDMDRNCVNSDQAEALFDVASTDLQSQGGTVPFDQANKSYVLIDDFGPRLAPVGPNTGGINATGAVFDCYGYGVNDDLPSLVVMADIGGSQFVDTDLTFKPGRTRNMAGLVSGVGSELIDNMNRTAIVAELDVTDRMLDPLIFVDLGALTIGTVFPIVDPEFSYRIEDGAVQTVSLSGSFTEGELLAEIQDRVTGFYSVVIRAVVVEGAAPAFIDDMDGDGRFTGRDVAMSGYTLLSNQARVRVRILPRELQNVEEDGYECPSNLIYADLNSDGLNGGCLDGDGSSRSIRSVPR